jgi:NAD(P)-dependent dehydrogenase (short-subunit alcohol dehydrogenase family)
MVISGRGKRQENVMQVTGPAVVIGGGSGIGRGLALAFASRGVPVVAGDIDLAAADETAALVTQAGGTAHALQVDGVERASIEEFAAGCEALVGPAAVLSSNLGISLERPLADATDAEWERMIAFNFMSTVRAVSVFLPQLRRFEGDRGIMITGSLAGFFAPTQRSWDGSHRGIYTTTKHALRGYAEILAAELAPENVTVSMLSPSVVLTNMGLTSAKFRPGAEDATLVADDVVQPAGNGLDPLELGRAAVTAMEAGRHVIAAPSAAREFVEARETALMADFDFMAGLGL